MVLPFRLAVDEPIFAMTRATCSKSRAVFGS